MKVIAMAACIFTMSLCTAQTVTKTHTYGSPLSIDASGDYGVSLTSVNFVSGVDFVPSALVSEVSVSVTFNKTDGSCASPASGSSYHSETSFRLQAPSGTQVILATSGTWTTQTSISPVTVQFNLSAGSTPSGTPVSGTFLPNGGNLADFMSQSPFGNWTLQAGDNVGSDPLCILSYSVTISTFDPLPVELTYFNASPDKSERTVNLNWETASEYNNEVFHLQKSNNMEDWEKFGEVLGQGTKFSPTVYSSKDNSPSVGTSYYRLKQVDYDGAYSFSNISPVFISPNAIVFPNPANRVFSINGKQLDKVQARLYDNTGRLVASNHGQMDTEILEMNVSECENGIYMLELAWPNHNEFISVNILN